jgi:hypothetical protein
VGRKWRREVHPRVDLAGRRAERRKVRIDNGVRIAIGIGFADAADVQRHVL